MTDLPPPRRPSPTRPHDVDTAGLLVGLAPAQAEALMSLVRERDHLFELHRALLAAARAESLETRLTIFAEAIRELGFGRVVVTLCDADLNPTRIVTSGLTEAEGRALRAAPASGRTWHRRLRAMERFRVSESYYLDGRDEWVRGEFHGALPSALELPGEGEEWHPRDTLLVPVRSGDGRVLATLALDDPTDGRRPSEARVRTVELFARQVANCLEQAALVELARHRAERLQRLQEVGSKLARSLDEREIVRELARQVGRVLPSDGIVVAHPDLELGRTVTAVRVVHGVERPRAPSPCGGGVIGEVARTGRPVLVAEYDPERNALAAADEVVGDGGPAGSVLAVPMLLGIQLVGVIAVHAAAPHAYGAEDEEVLLTIGTQAATAVVNARLYAESQRERRQSEALADVARAVGESLRLGEVLHLILRHATALLRTEGACVSLVQGDYLHVVAGVGSAEVLSGMHLPIAASTSGRVVREGAYIISNDAQNDPQSYRPTQRAANIRNTVIVPLITGRGAIGVLSVINRDEEFADEDARVLQRLADQVAVAIVNARLFEEAAEATREWSVAFDAIASGMVILDAAGRVTRANARAAELVGGDGAEALVGCDFHGALLFGQHAAGERCPVDDALDGRGGGRASLRSERRGRVFDVVAARHPAGGAVVTFDDVTSHHTLAERHRRVVETASDALVITDLERRIAFANPAALELFGATELVGRPVSDLVAPETLDAVRRHEDLAAAGEPQQYEAVVTRLDGERRNVAVSTAPLREVGQITGIVASLRDNTNERRARDAVAASESRYRNLFETASDAIFTLDAGGVFTSTNAATCALAGEPRERLLGRPVLAFIAAEDARRVRAHFLAALGGESPRFECGVRRGSGERRLVSVTNSPIRRGSAFVGVLGVARDVTAEREREAALVRSEARYAHLVESASDAIFTVDADGVFTSVNRALEIATGLKRETLVGRRFTDLVDPRDRDDCWGAFEETLRGARERRDFRYVAAGGDSRPASIITAPVVEEGRVTGGLGVVRDVADERRLLEQFLQHEKMAAVGQLVAGVAHELNNPLASVMACSQLLLESDGVRGEDRAAARSIYEESARAAKIVANLLTFARQHQPAPARIDLNQVVGDTLDFRRYALALQNIELETAFDDRMPCAWADPVQIQQVVLNLLANAEQALAGRAGVRRICVATARRGATIELSVSDSGPGVPAESRGRIFNPFYTTRPVGRGIGLGLSISDGIVREHRGQIRVEGDEGGGATFVVELPVASPDGSAE